MDKSEIIIRFDVATETLEKAYKAACRDTQHTFTRQQIYEFCGVLQNMYKFRKLLTGGNEDGQENSTE